MVETKKLDLTLVLIKDTSFWTDYNRLILSRDMDLFAQLIFVLNHPMPVCQTRPLPEDVDFRWNTWGVLEDARGVPLRYLPAHELAKIDVSTTDQWNRAIFALVRTLPPLTPIVLWWH